ncbi:MAG: dual specificity protein phosphatase family protein [Phycisphaerae bacterium]|jgi:protein tyrosine phosphatase (PTP) superfamily phosphohydrolase (DUF442 family)|nr:dual specificity protein phosphatase family protein [Phycisphaerae bacterium]
MFIAACSDPPADAVSGASPETPHKKMTLPPAGSDYEIVGVKDGLSGYMIKYDDKLYRGGQMNNAKGLDFLKKLGITTVVTITPTDDERTYVVKRGMKLLEVPFAKTDGPSTEILDAFLEAVKSSTGPVYVHCHGGTHRAAILAGLYRMAVKGWDFNRTAVEFGTLGGDLKGDHAMLGRIREYAKPSSGTQ